MTNYVIPTCNGKRVFRTKSEADRFKKGSRMSRITKKKIIVYQCEDCFKWHLSTLKK